MNRCKLVAVSLMLIAGSSVMAENNSSYGGVAYHMGAYSAGTYGDFSPKAIELKYGNYLSDGLALETRLMLGMGGDSKPYGTGKVELELKNALSLFIKSDMKLSEKVSAYGLLGLSKVEFKATGSTDSKSASVSGSGIGLSFGLGTAVSLGKSLSLSIEYILYSGINIGVIQFF